MMDKNEIIKRLERLARGATHTVGEPPFVMSLDDGIAIHEAIDIIQKSQRTNYAEVIQAADVAPVRHGEWAETVTDGFLFVSCSACGFKTGRIDYNYCPNCGAKMDEE